MKQFTKLLKVGTADKALDVNTLHRASLVTCATTGTLGVVDGCKVVFNLNCALGTNLLALHTTDTTVRAELTNNSALVMAGALNKNSGLLANDVNNAVGTSLSAKATANALLRIDLSDALLSIDNDCALRTNCHTVAVAETSISTVAVAGISAGLNSRACLNAVVNILSLLGLASAVAGYVCNLCINVAGCKTHDLGELSSNVCSTGSTETGIIGSTLAKSLSVSVASGVTASATVSAGETVTDRNGSLVLLYAEEYRRKGKENCAYDSDTYEDKNRNKYSHFLPPYASRFSTTPANPKNARATMEAAMSVIGTPRKHLGEGQFSILERTPAKSTIARRKPRPTPSEEIIDWMKL